MHIAEVVTIAKSLPLLRLNTYKSLILSYSADYRRIFTKNNTVLPTGEKNCIQCQLCVKHCPTDSIYINVSFANGMRIAFREMFSTKLQNRYKSKAE